MNSRKSFAFGNDDQHDIRASAAGVGLPSPTRRTNSVSFDTLTSSPALLTDTNCDSEIQRNDKLKVMQQESEIKHLQQILDQVIAQRNALLCEVEQLKFQAVAGELCQIDRPSSSMDLRMLGMGSTLSLNNSYHQKQAPNRNNSGSKKQDVGEGRTFIGAKAEKVDNDGSATDGGAGENLDQSFGYLEPEIEFSLICQDLIGMSVDDDSKLR